MVLALGLGFRNSPDPPRSPALNDFERVYLLLCSEEDVEKADPTPTTEKKPKENKTPPKDEPSPKIRVKKESISKAVKRKLSGGSPKDAPSTKRVSKINETDEVSLDATLMSVGE